MRCYNGCPDKELQALIDSRQAAKDEAKRLGIQLTWFPVEEKWAACTSMDNDEPYRELSGYCTTIYQALEEAKGNLS